MATKADIDEFLAQKTLAVVGVSRDERKFGSLLYRELKKMGYNLYPVNPNAGTLGCEKCYPSLRALPETVDSAVIVVPPAQTETVVRDAIAAGFKRIWIQQQSETPDAVRLCQEHDIQLIQKECLLMFAEPGAFHHHMHRWFKRITRTLPQ